MSYHDKHFIGVAQKTSRLANRRLKSVMRGINLITLNPPSPKMTTGSLADDWRAVGDDMRKAMQQIKLVD